MAFFIGGVPLPLTVRRRFTGRVCCGRKLQPTARRWTTARWRVRALAASSANDFGDDEDGTASSVTNVYGTNRGAKSDQMFTVRVEYDGQTHDIPCADGQSILDAVEASGHWDEVPCSCRAGVCTTCAAWLLSGEVDAPFATLVEDIQQQGFILTCSSTPKSGSEMVHVRLGAFETVYHMQYGRFEANTEKS